MWGSEVDDETCKVVGREISGKTAAEEKRESVPHQSACALWLARNRAVRQSVQPLRTQAGKFRTDILRWKGCESARCQLRAE